MVAFKKDSAFNTPLSLAPDRELPVGHNGFNFNECTDEISALQAIIDEYIDTTSLETILTFYEHKIDFSVTFIDSLILILSKKYSLIHEQYDETEKQLEAISHRMIKPFIDGGTTTNAEKLEIYEQQEHLLIQRRNLKDSIAVLKVCIENFENARNFVLGMSKRRYTPQTDKYKNDDRFQLGKCNKNIENSGGASDSTRVKLPK